jgi:ATP-dependent Lon protease
VTVELITVEDYKIGEQQAGYLDEIVASSEAAGIKFSWQFEDSSKIHARHIVTDHGWKILLDRGLDVFQRYEMNDAFAISNRIQEYRSCKPFEVTYLKADSPKA